LSIFRRELNRPSTTYFGRTTI